MIEGVKDMPHFPEWFVLICIMFPIAYNIYKLWKDKKNKKGK